MLGSALLLTLAALTGLAAGFAREWLLVADWGAGARADAWLVAMFLPEALRGLLSGGVLSAAALPLWQALAPEDRPRWLAGQVWHWLLIGGLLSVAMAGAAPALVRVVGPGLPGPAVAEAARALGWLGLAAPGLLLQALLAVPLQARGHFLLAGFGSLLFNLPAVLYLASAGPLADEIRLAQSFGLGSLLMAAVLLPGAWEEGWRPWLRGSLVDCALLWRLLGPLLASGAASQVLGWLERLAASLLGEGTITQVNLARKLINLPLVALMSLNQVLLGNMSGLDGSGRLNLLRNGLAVCFALTLPAMIGLIGAAPALVELLLPRGLGAGPLPALLACYAPGLVFGGWNGLLARYFYAGGDTRTPLALELAGSALQAGALLAFPLFLGLNGLALAALLGTLATGALLSSRAGHGLGPELMRMGGWTALAAVLCAGWLFPLDGTWRQLGAASACGAAAMAILAWRARRR